MEVGVNIDGATVTILADGDGIDSNGNVTVVVILSTSTQTIADNAVDYGWNRYYFGRYCMGYW